jgi:hypothetical protein
LIHSIEPARRCHDLYMCWPRDSIAVAMCGRPARLALDGLLTPLEPYIDLRALRAVSWDMKHARCLLPPASSRTLGDVLTAAPLLLANGTNGMGSCWLRCSNQGEWFTVGVARTVGAADVSLETLRGVS